MGVTKKHKQIVSVCQLTSIKYAKNNIYYKSCRIPHKNVTHNENPLPLIFYFLVYNSMIQQSLYVIHIEIKLTNWNC